MKQTLLVMALVALGVSVRAQTQILSDSFDTGGVASSDLNYNQVARQAGVAAPVDLYVATNYVPLSTNSTDISLTSAGKLNMKGVTGRLDTVVTDSFGDEIGNASFSVRWKTRTAASVPDGNWSMMSILSDTNNLWYTSPMTVNLWSQNIIHIYYGDINNTLTNNDLGIELTQSLLDSAIGGSYDAGDEHEFEIKACAKNAVTGTWSFYIDGVIVAGGLPYTFEDSAKRMSWFAYNDTDAEWDDLNVSTFPAFSKEYLFFDNFDVSDQSGANWFYGPRQTNGTVVTSYNGNPDLYNITNFSGNGKLHQYWLQAFANQTADLGSALDGKDFEFSCKVAQLEDSDAWTSIYLFDETGGRDDSRLGMQIPGAASPWSFIFYFGAGAGQEVFGIDADWFSELAPFDKAEEHTYRFVSYGGNSYEVYVDGVEIFDGATMGLPNALPYQFDGTQRRIGIVGTMPTDLSKGAFYDDVYIKVFEGTSYEEWVADDTGLAAGVNDARGDDPDSDSMNNLLEYALGGNPLVSDASSILPTFDLVSSDTVAYVYRRRVDAAIRGLDYGVATVGDLQGGTWTNNGAAFETGAAEIDFQFESVTNTISTAGQNGEFLKLEVLEN